MWFAFDLRRVMFLYVVVVVVYYYLTMHIRDGTGQDFLDPTRPVNFKIIAG